MGIIKLTVTNLPPDRFAVAADKTPALVRVVAPDDSSMVK